MLTPEELMEKCQELREAANLLMEAMHENDYIYNYISYKVNLSYRESSLLSIYLENRDSISDEDAEEIIRTIIISGTVEGFAALALGNKKYYRLDLINILWNELK